MSKLTIVVFSLLGLISACVGQGVIQTGQCDQTIEVVNNFVAADYVGTWYDIESLPSGFQSGTCNTATYAAAPTGLSITNTQVDSNGVLQTVTGTATPQAGITAGQAKFDVIISGNTPAVPYWVLDTDYSTFALVYSCRNVNLLTRQVNSWKLSRTRTLSAEANNRINLRISAVQALNQAVNSFEQRDHSAEACSYFFELEGACPTVNGVPNFDASLGPSSYNYIAWKNLGRVGLIIFGEYNNKHNYRRTSLTGTWYESARYRQEFQTGQCNRAEYAVGANGIVTVQNSQVISQALHTRSGVAFEVVGRPGVLQVNFNVNDELRSQNLVVVATDYINYALLYSCRNIEGTTRRRVYSWQLRKQLAELDSVSITAINNAINANTELQQAPYVPTSQSDASCFYYPEWTTLPATIELPGPCDSTITGATAFNAQTFIGTWYEVARYPQPTQAGQCNRAVYGPISTAGVVTVQNSQVTSEALSTIPGTATPVAGQNGVLDVTLTTSSGNVQQTLIVLATDNNNYALLYSCENIPGNRRRVGSWKMSKQLGPLSAAASASINSAIEATQGLRESYYLPPTSQTDLACFYYPEWTTLPATIDLPGPCDTTITGVVGFDANRFLGTWYEVARYPQPTQAGQCNRAVYGPIVTGGVITVQNSQVISEALSTIPGTATPVAGQSGVIDVTLTTSSGPVTRRLIVLATDYDNYALLYTCENINGNAQRRVGSWQLTKNLGPLNAESNVAISAKIETTQGLRQSYYQPTSQTNAACFYYPEWATLPPTIELPGPCDTTITGATTFNAQTFIGTWYEIERYPQPTQAGQCNRAVYGPISAGGVITVQNSQVTAETLSTIPGTATPVAGQTGVINVTLTTSSGPVNQLLVVLATDNTNFALLYSCENIDGNTRRRVGSWKMSKQLGQLSEAANATINSLIASTQGLRQNYYQTTNQGDTACFHYPATQAGEQVVIPGQCDAAIIGQPNINLTRFANSSAAWYHIQRYDQVGNKTCIGTRLSYETSAEGNSIIVNNVELAGGVENRTEGTAQLTTVASGQFSLTWSGLEGTRTIYVMATDYDGYAIAYTCQNSGTANRQVGVWLLSRQRTWPEAGATALLALVNNRPEFTLREGYFKVIPHNDDCPEPSSAFLFKSSIIVIFVCTILQFVW